VEPAVEDQATDRAHRIGQTRPVQVHRLIAEGTIEDRIAAMLASKRELADAVLTAGEAALTELSDTELAELVESPPSPMTEVARGFPAFAARSGRAGTRGGPGGPRVGAGRREHVTRREPAAGRPAVCQLRTVGTITVSPGRLAATVYGDDENTSRSSWSTASARRTGNGFSDRVPSAPATSRRWSTARCRRNWWIPRQPSACACCRGSATWIRRAPARGWELPCRHAAALCYQLGWLLDEDPFVLLLLRGRSRSRLLDDLQLRSTVPPQPHDPVAGDIQTPDRRSGGTPAGEASVHPSAGRAPGRPGAAAPAPRG
jgi:hypothetical protein